MKKKTVHATLTVALLILSLNLLSFRYAKAEGAGGAYTIEWVSHKVEVLYNGYIFINDTVKLSGAVPAEFYMGFPYQYGFHVLQCIAYNNVDPSQRYTVTSNVPLDGRLGFYSVKVELSQQDSPQVFTVGFVLSNSLLRQDDQNASFFTLDFPAYPSLTKTALSCNAYIVLPKGAEYVNGTITSFNYAENVELPAFAYEPANVTFRLAGEDIQLFVVEGLEREIRIGGAGEIEGSDRYYIRSLSTRDIASVNVVLPLNASAVTAEDEFGRKAKTSPSLVDAETNRYKISLVLPVESGRATIFFVKYTLPKEVYMKSDGSGVEFALPAFKNMDYYVEKASITFILPEGARVTTVSHNHSAPITFDLTRDVFHEKAALSVRGIFSLEGFTVKIAYQYNPLWLSFRPTLWVWTVAVLGCVIIALVKRPKVPVSVALPVPTVAVRLTPEMVKSFVDSYEEKRKIISEIKTLEAGVRRGRIPRRRYKVQRKSLEVRLNSLSRTLDDLKQKLRAAGGRYADLMNQLDRAEAEIDDAEANMRSIEARHSKGELSLEAYRKLLGEYEHKKESAEAKISGILVRLRE
ncbi:MAG: hypothetical protein RMJ15_06305 [Nitrososphaerota archaeon]|nr:hypothetical protein [Candidatus Bathyarchaeota archaeon]MDW8023330.1 hypothetical protein [Nitrososphaerota archaeon]